MTILTIKIVDGETMIIPIIISVVNGDLKKIPTRTIVHGKTIEIIIIIPLMKKITIEGEVEEEAGVEAVEKVEEVEEEI